MRLYLDLNCFNRPFDDQSQERIRMETEAILSILNRVVEGRDHLVWSEALTFENSQHPKLDRAAEIALWQRRAPETVMISAEIAQRARAISMAGVPALDAIHIASAEVGMADVLLTCDDDLNTRARRVRLLPPVFNPV